MKRKLKIAVISDLHLEFENWTPEVGAFDDVDLVINAGDTHPKFAFRKRTRTWFVDTFAPHAKYFEVLGNHDYWDGDIEMNGGEGINYMVINGFTIVGAVLWSKVSTITEWYEFRNFGPDPHRIKNVNYDLWNRAHEDHKKYIFDSIPDVVVTHYLPSYRSVNEKWKGSSFNFAFATELENRILDMKHPPQLWVHGHTHDPCDYTFENGIRVLCNPRGYPDENVQDVYGKVYKPVYVTLEKD